MPKKPVKKRKAPAKKFRSGNAYMEDHAYRPSYSVRVDRNIEMKAKGYVDTRDITPGTSKAYHKKSMIRYGTEWRKKKPAKTTVATKRKAPKENQPFSEQNINAMLRET